MATTLPGTTIEVSDIHKGVSRQLFDGIFAAGGITLAQVSVMTGLEPYRIQNWVKRGFVSSPQHRQYSKNQFARIVIIHMLCESLQLDRICELLSYINGNLHDESDDVIGDSELYHRYTDMIAETAFNDFFCSRSVEDDVVFEYGFKFFIIHFVYRKCCEL